MLNLLKSITLLCSETHASVVGINIPVPVTRRNSQSRHMSKTALPLFIININNPKPNFVSISSRESKNDENKKIIGGD
jgi:hypothetical protein